MKRIFSLAAIALLLAFAPIAPAKTTAIEAQTFTPPFYLAQKGGAKVYIFGTMHVGRVGDKLPEKIVSALKNSSKLYMEVSSEELQKSEELAFSFECGKDCLKNELSAPLFNRLIKEYPELRGVPTFDRMPAWYALTLAVMIEYMKAGYYPNRGSETALMSKWGDRETFGFETAAEQFNAMISVSIEANRAAIADYLTLSKDKKTEQIDELYKAWREGDSDKLYMLANRADFTPTLDKKYRDEFDQKLIVDRNKKFAIGIIKNRDQKSPIFVAIGAAHLGGEKGVLNLLKQDGWTIERIK